VCDGSSIAARTGRARRANQRVSLMDAMVALGSMFLLVGMDFQDVGAEPWVFSAGPIHAHGVLRQVVELFGSRWDVGALRSVTVLLLGLISMIGTLIARGWRPSRLVLSAVMVTVAAGVVLPPVVLQVGLRESTEPWFYTNDSTYQIELAGDLARHRQSPYGYDYRHSGLARFYTLRGSVSRRVNDLPTLRHYPYFPGSVVASVFWRSLPSPWNDYRLFVALTTLLLMPAALVYPGPLGLRLALGAALACNPVAVRLAWFGNADAPCILALVVAFGLATRGKCRSAGVALAAAILFKQFALAAVPFLFVLMAVAGSKREVLRAALTGATALTVVFAPFLVASPSDVWRDTVVYGTSTYHVVSYGASGVLAHFGILNRRSTRYPWFAVMAFVWLPITAYLVRVQWRLKDPWLAGAGFTVSVFLLIAIARVFQQSYVIYPLSGAGIALLLALERLELNPAGSR
jgi:hypothetical protein